MRNCKGCVYARWMGKKAYCMFFSAPSCPRGKGLVINLLGNEETETPKPKKKKETIYPPPFKARKSSKVKSVLRENHDAIYEMRYEKNMMYKDIAKEFDVTASAIISYMNRCDFDYIDAGHTEWREFIKNFDKPGLEQDGLTEAGNIPPYKVCSKFSTRHKNSPLRKKHDEIFNMRKEGYTIQEIAITLGLHAGSLYSYIERCENEWANRQVGE